jgi:hypothetical protein
LNPSGPLIISCHYPNRFDIMNRIIYKSYQNLTNILLRISSSHEESKTLAILLNSHLDSTLPSPGAADDALAVGISLEVARVLIEAAGRGDWEVGWGIVIRQLFLHRSGSLISLSCSLYHLLSPQQCRGVIPRRIAPLFYPASMGPDYPYRR